MHTVVVFAFRKTSCDGSQLCDSELQFMFTEKRSADVLLANSERCSYNVNRVYHQKDPLRFGIALGHDGINFQYF